jgi:hypothetical protein
MEEIVKRLSEKGYNVNTDRIPNCKGEILSIIFVWGFLAAIMM